MACDLADDLSEAFAFIARKAMIIKNPLIDKMRILNAAEGEGRITLAGISQLTLPRLMT